MKKSIGEAKKGNVLANRGDRLFRKACAAWDKGKLEQAFKLFSKAAELGDKSSQSNLGYFYDTGLYVPQNTQQALYWNRKAYRQGDLAAASNIATVYRDAGDGQRMVWWYKRAATLGDTAALFEIAKHYQNGECIRKDLDKAKMFLQRVFNHKYATKEDKANARKLLSKLMAHRIRPVCRNTDGQKGDQR